MEHPQIKRPLTNELASFSVLDFRDR